MPGPLLHRLLALGRAAVHGFRRRPLAATRPTVAPVAVGTLADRARSKPALVAENAFLRHQLAILHRSVRRQRCSAADRALLVLLASRVRAWRSALLLVQPDTPLCWHRHLFRWHRLPGAPATVALIRELAAANRRWGAERIRGELRKLGIRVATSTIQRCLREARPRRRTGQPRATFLRNHAGEIWACDFRPFTDLLFRPLHACFVIALKTRRAIHAGVTRQPTDAWVAQ